MRRTLAVTLTAAALTLAGCNSGGETSTGSGAGSTPGGPAGAGGAATSAPPATAAPTTTVDPGTLPQTEAKPTVDSADFERRVQAMWQGIVDDDPKKAQEFFFPLSAYKQVKSLQDPTAEWNNRLIAI